MEKILDIIALADYTRKKFNPYGARAEKIPVKSLLAASFLLCECRKDIQR